MAYRRIGRKYCVRDGDIVNIVSGEVLSPDEPVFLLRARDALSVRALMAYRRLCCDIGCGRWQLDGLAGTLEEFTRWREQHPDLIKEPGVTEGK